MHFSFKSGPLLCTRIHFTHPMPNPGGSVLRLLQCKLPMFSNTLYPHRTSVNDFNLHSTNSNHTKCLSHATIPLAWRQKCHRFCPVVVPIAALRLQSLLCQSNPWACHPAGCHSGRDVQQPGTIGFGLGLLGWLCCCCCCVCSACWPCASCLAAAVGGCVTAFGQVKKFVVLQIFM